MEGRKVFCSTYFSILYNVQLSGYLCSARDTTAWKYIEQHNVQLLIVGTDIQYRHYQSSCCSWWLHIIIIEIRPTRALNESHIVPEKTYYRVFQFKIYLNYDIGFLSCPPLNISYCSKRPSYGIYFPKDAQDSGNPICGTYANYTFRISKLHVDAYLGSAFQMKTSKGIKVVDYLTYVAEFHALIGSRICYSGYPTGQWLMEKKHRYVPDPEPYIVWPKDLRGKLWVQNVPSIIAAGKSIPLVLLTGVTLVNFATCNGVGQRFSFLIYVQPYDAWCWSLIIFGTSLVPVALALLAKFQLGPIPASWKFITALFWSSASILVDSSSNVDDSILMQMKICTKCRLIFGSWFLVAVVIVNANKSLLTSNILAPPTPTHTWTSLNQLEGFYIADEGLSYTQFLGRAAENPTSIEASVLGSLPWDCAELGMPDSGAGKLGLVTNCTNYVSHKHFNACAVCIPTLDSL